MKILEEIRQGFASASGNTALKINSIDQKYPAWVIRYGGWYGVGIPVAAETVVSEQFSSARLYTKELTIQGVEHNLLMLASAAEELRTEFAVVCAQFADPGESGREREDLAGNPAGWWERWRSLLGNSIQDKPTYSILGELIVYKYLLEKGESPEWRGMDGSTHDIELPDRSIEVKSTLSRYESLVTINGQFQLQNAGKDLYLVFCRFEPSSSGVSIDEMVEQAVALGIRSERLNRKLAKAGLEAGSSARLEKFKLHEVRIYKVDEDFPVITPDSFKGNKMPEAVKQLNYKIDLSSISYDSMKI